MTLNTSKSTLHVECPCGGSLDTQYDTDYKSERAHAELLADKFFAVHNATHMAAQIMAQARVSRGDGPQDAPPEGTS